MATIADYFPSGNPPKLTVKTIAVPPLEEALSEPEDLEAAMAPVLDVLTGTRFAVITGAGISTDSGLPDYRSPGSKVRHPMTLQQFMSSERMRRHYWARNHAGWLYPARATPNPGHRALVALEEADLLTGVITQNVDMLHDRAGQRTVVHLHGRYDQVICTACSLRMDRASLHEGLVALNPGATEHVEDVEIAPDADVALSNTENFTILDCPNCGGILRTDVVFFGGKVRPEDQERATTIVDEGEALLVAGSSLAVGSAFRLVRRSHRANKPIVILTKGRTRADDLATVHVPVSTTRALPYLAGSLPSS